MNFLRNVGNVIQKFGKKLLDPAPLPQFSLKGLEALVRVMERLKHGLGQFGAPRK